MLHLHESLGHRVDAWREAGYPHDDHAVIAEILDFQVDAASGTTRFLRVPQLRALETYWYLRLALDTPHVLDLYRELFPQNSEFLEALGLDRPALEKIALDAGIDELLKRVRTDDELVRTHKLEAVRETLALDYPSYILALAMGAGKTILIGAIIATEFAMAQEYPDGDFVQNALVFAPGKTILEALRELTEVPYDRILPPRMHAPFAAAVSLTFTRDGDPDIPVVVGSLFNVVVTNTEKIRIRKETIRKSELGTLFSGADDDEARENVANLRLRRIASLPHLGVFSDEAHHTYGQNLLGKWRRDRETGERTFRESGVKKVRMTVDYLADKTNLVCVINTTGTPYFQRQPLRDVVIWYGLSQGIGDGILKDVQDNIEGYEYAEEQAVDVVRDIVTDFFERYGHVNLPDGAPAKLAMYFPQTKDLASLRPAVEVALAGMGIPTTVVLVNTSKSSTEEVDAFNRLNDPRSPHRVILLVNKGTEGWNCPSLFGCALVRKLKTSNNFVLQAATRCLRQVPGNGRKARIYLSMENRSVLDRQLRETYGESLVDLERTPRSRRTARLVLRKFRMPPLVVTRRIRRVVPAEKQAVGSKVLEPPVVDAPAVRRTTLALDGGGAGARLLRAVGDAVRIERDEEDLDLRSAAVELAGVHREEVWTVLQALRDAYGEDDVPVMHMPRLHRQVEEWGAGYRVEEETVEEAMALIRLDPRTGEPDPRGWDHDTDGRGEPVYTAEIAYYPEREHLLKRIEARPDLAHDLGFHYTPYDFDSAPEEDFFRRMLIPLDLAADEVEDIYFTGSVTDPSKTEFFVEYKDGDGRWRRYSPDFVIRRKDGRVVVVEIKAERDRANPVTGERGAKAMAVRRWRDLDPDALRYEILFTGTDAVSMGDVQKVLDHLDLGDGGDGSALLPVREETLHAFCEKWGVATLEVFGSTATGSADGGSDVDILVRFLEGRVPGLFDLTRMEEELAALLGRKVDLVDRAGVERSENPYRRGSILRSAVPVYRAPK